MNVSKTQVSDPMDAFARDQTERVEILYLAHRELRSYAELHWYWVIKFADQRDSIIDRKVEE